MKTYFSTTICLLAFFSVFSQTIEYYDADWNRIDSKKGAAYYREVNYDENDNPLGFVKDYYITGELQFEGKIIAINPDVLDGKCTWYYKDGKKRQEATFRKGIMIEGPKKWTAEGKILEEPEYFFSEKNRNLLLEGLSERFGRKLLIDSITVEFLLKLGKSMLSKGDFDSAKTLFESAHDISKIIKDELKRSISFNNIGTVYRAKGELERALEWYNKAVQIQLILNQASSLAILYNNIGSAHSAQGKFELALDWYRKAVSIQQKRKLDADLALSYKNIGTIYKSQGKLATCLDYYQKAMEIQQEFKLEPGLAKSYNNIAAVLQLQRNFSEALTWYEKAVHIQQKLKLELDLARSYNNIGTFYQSQSNFVEALIWFRKAEEIQKRLRYEVGLARSFNNIGLVFQAQGNFLDAKTEYQKAQTIQERLNLEVDLSDTYNNIGSLYHAQGNFSNALNWYNKARAIQEKLSLQLNLSATLNNIGNTISAQGDLEKAMVWYKKALVLGEELNLIADLPSSYNNLGSIYHSKGSLEKAIIWYDKAEAIQVDLNLEEALAKTYTNKGSVFHSQGSFEEALTFFRKALKIQTRLDLEVDLARSCNNTGAVYQSQLDLEKALKWYNKAKVIQERLNLEIDLATTYNNIGTVYRIKENFKEALIWIEKSEVIQQSLGLEVDLARTLNNIGILYDNLGNPDKALSYYQQAKDIRQRLNLEFDLAGSFSNLAVSYFYKLQLDSALHYATKNVSLNERIRNYNRGNSSRQIYVNKSLDAAEIGVMSAFSLDNLRRSFSFSEKSKSRGLLDLLNEQKIKTSNLPDALWLKLRNTDKQLFAFNQELANEMPIEKRKNIIQLRDSLYSIQSRLKEKVKAISPGYANLIYPETVNSEQVKSILSDNEVFISYITGDLNTFAYVLTHSELFMVGLGRSDSLIHLIKEFREDYIQQQKAILTADQSNRFLQAKLNQRFFQVSKQLYQRLWAPLDSIGVLDGKNVILVPDGFLNYLPFELLVKDSVQQDFQGYQYIVKDHSISYYPSATVLHFERTKEKKGSKPNQDLFGLAVSDFENVLCTDDGKPLKNLDNTLPSIESIKNSFNQKKSTFLINEDANRDKFSSLNLKDYRYLHFATHGQINSEKPEFSTILLHDACLNLYEIFELEFNADLVTLSACETGLGKLVRGEGMVGFTRALMYAGTPSVILSLWEVGDDSTKELFVNYYGKLSKDGSQKYTPLREVQLQMIKSGKYSNPYFWAPFVFIGEGESKF